MYSQALGPAAALGVGKGQPPNLPDALPSPTGIGAIPTGSPGSTPKEIADAAIIKLRAAAAQFPNLAQQLNACADALKQAAQAPGGAAPLSAAPKPGSPLPEVAPTALSGTAGT